jgi:hypothetical protein
MRNASGLAWHRGGRQARPPILSSRIDAHQVGLRQCVDAGRGFDVLAARVANIEMADIQDGKFGVVTMIAAASALE